MSFEEVTEEQRRVITASICSDDEKLEADVARVRDWLGHQPHIPSHAISDVLIKSFLLGSRGIEVAKERLDGYFTARSLHPEFFLGMDPSTFRLPVSQQTFFLPRLTTRGHRVLIYRITEPDLAGFDHFDSLKRDYIMLSLMFETSLQCGVVLVFDLVSVHPSSLSKLNISACTLSNKVHKCGMPLKVKKIVILNAPALVARTIETVILPFLNSKLIRRLVIKSDRDLSVLREFLGEDDIPSDMGGQGPSAVAMDEAWRKTLRDRREWCISLGGLKTDESKRPAGSQLKSDTDSVVGTFRCLSID